MEVSDQEVIQVMIDGGRRLCDYAKEQWVAGKYGRDNQQMIRDNLQRWNAIECRISELGKLLKGAIRESTNSR